jgi:hypothetical protein
MIRVYLDTNIFSSLKLPEKKEILDFLITHNDSIIVPFSEAHFRDIMKSYSVKNPKFYEDLELYDKICGSHLLQWENDHISPKDCTPSQYFESVKDDYTYSTEINFAETFDEIETSTNELSPETNFSEIINNLKKLPAGIEITDQNRSLLGQLFPNLRSDSTFWELMQDISTIGNKLLNDKESYIGLRSSIHQHGLKLDVNSGNWEVEEVISKIDSYLKSFHETLSFDQFITSSRKDIGKTLSIYEYFNTAYLILDLIGYKSDRLSKPSNNMWNIYTDADHAFYAATCDYFICNDKNLLSRSSVLYHYLNIDTKIMNLDALIDSISPYITPKFSGAQLLVDEISLVLNDVKAKTPSQIIESPELNTKIYTYLLNRKFLNIFNAVFTVEYKHEDLNVLEITFSIRYQNYSRFLYNSELYNCISRLNHILGFANYDVNVIYNTYINAESDQVVFKWISNTINIFLIKEPNTFRPILIYGEKYI